MKNKYFSNRKRKFVVGGGNIPWGKLGMNGTEALGVSNKEIGGQNPNGPSRIRSAAEAFYEYNPYRKKKIKEKKKI